MTKTQYVVTVRDRDNRLLHLLEHIKRHGNVGHSFRIVVDPEERGGQTFYWDGDGSDRILEIAKLEGDAGMREEALCVRQIVKKYLRDNGYDGLWCDECACVTDDIAPCGHIGEDCEAGYKRLVPPDESCGCCGQGCEHWHIEPKETQEETP